MKKILIALVLASLLGCVQQPTKPQDLSAFNATAPRSILVVPVVNHSLDIDAPNYVLSALPVPLAEKGYYVFPVNTVRYVLEQEGYYEGERVQREPPETLAKMFDADAILYVTINRWDAQYAVFSTTVTVDFSYRMVNRQGIEIWKNEQSFVYQPQGQSSGNPLADLISAAISAALTRAAPNYMPLTQQANARAFMYGPNAVPDGPYKKTAAVDTKH